MTLRMCLDTASNPPGRQKVKQLEALAGFRCKRASSTAKFWYDSGLDAIDINPHIDSESSETLKD